MKNERRKSILSPLAVALAMNAPLSLNPMGIQTETYEDYLDRKLKSSKAKTKEQTEFDHQRIAKAEERRQRRLARNKGIKL
jgi:hypothetical protein